MLQGVAARFARAVVPRTSLPPEGMRERKGREEWIGGRRGRYFPRTNQGDDT
jgi:hypothetical protein